MHEKILSKKDVIKGWAKYFLCAEVSSGFERLTAPAFCFGMDPVLNKLYHDSPEEYKEALKRHLMFYNSEASWGSMIYGISCAWKRNGHKCFRQERHNRHWKIQHSLSRTLRLD